MPIRQRIKRALTGRSSTSSDRHSLPKSASNKPDPNVYQPGEKMPPMKYRRPVAPEHKEKLEAFSFAAAWRRRSAHSQYSPMGSRMPSRKNSTATNGRKSMQQSRLSMQAPRTSMSTVDAGRVKEGSDSEGDVTNVGLSREHTHDSLRSRHSSVRGRSQSIRTGGSRPPTGRRSGSVKRGDTAFTPEDLEVALWKSHIDVPHTHHEVNTEPPTVAPTEAPSPTEVPSPNTEEPSPGTEEPTPKQDSAQP